jgi:L-asparagine oxygenase
MPAEKDSIREYRLCDAERDRLYEALTRVEYDDAGPFNPFVRAADRAFSAAASSETADVLHEFKNGPGAAGVLLIENVPFDPNVRRGLLEGEAPLRAKANGLSEAFLVGAVSQVGEPYSIHQEGSALVNNLCPSREHLLQFTGLGSRAPLGLHIENAAARLLPGNRAPEGLALVGVSKEPGEGPATPVADGRLALSLCDPVVERELRQPNFKVRFPNRWSADGAADSSLRTRALVGPKENPLFIAAFYDDILTALTQGAESALAEFARALDSVATAVHIEPGLAVLLNNQFVFHGRGSFNASFDEGGRPYRWVQRVFWTSTLRRMGEWEWVRDRVVRPLVVPSALRRRVA